MKSNSTTRKSSASSKSAAGKKSTAQKKSNGQSSRKTSSARSSANGSAGGRVARKSGSRTPQDSLKKMFEDLLKDTYWAEKHLTKALPKMSKAAESAELKEAFDTHLQQTEEQVSRLEHVFELCDLKVSAKKCEAMEGLVEEGKEVMEEHESGPVRDAALIIAAQKVEHYEIAAYGSMRTLAQVMGYEDAAQLLEETLEEEANTDELLTQLAMSINQEAFGALEDSEEEEEDEDDSDEADDIEASDEDDAEDVEDYEEEEEESTSRR